MTASLGRAALTLILTAAALVGLDPHASPAAAQDLEYRISQRATLSQKLGQTLVSLDYSRPLVRGRDELFGEVVHWGELWTPGANQATVLETDKPLKLDGHDVPAGRWSMWIIPSQVGPWELVLDPRDSLFHTQRPEPTDDQVRFAIEHGWDGPETEALMWTFPRIAQDGGTLRMNWSTLQIDLDVAVESTQPEIAVSEEDAAPYVGEWTVTFAGPPPSDDAPSSDDAPPSDEAPSPPPPAPLTIQRDVDGVLQPIFPPETFAPPPSEQDTLDLAALSPQEREREEARRALAEPGLDDKYRMALVPRAPGVFMMAWLEGDVLLDLEPVYFEFEMEGDRAVRLQVRDGNQDRVVATAVRAER